MQSSPATVAPITASPKPQPSADSNALLALCKASSDQLRLDILRVLNRDSFGVSELCSILDHKQSGLSHHLKILATAGLVDKRREGNNIFYRRAHAPANDTLAQLHRALLAASAALPLSQQQLQRMDAIQLERQQRSRAFFSDNADFFRQQQEQVAAYELYGMHAAELLRANIPAGGRVLELGPGEGAFLAELSPHCETVYALDNSEQMLDKARGFAAEHKLGNIEFIHGDLSHDKDSSELSELAIDAVAVNMVLHHVPSPAEIFTELAALLSSGGQCFITDLCQHDQSWVQEACGDFWLGFDPKDLTAWAEDAGFEEGQSVYLSQRNGFRVQIRQFIKR